jgi:DNA-binding MarR family transcriptional regulator
MSKDTKEPALDSSTATAQAMLASLPRVMWFIRFHMRQNRHNGLSVPQFRTLAQLASFGSVSVSCVAENLGCSLPTASRMIDKLVAASFVDRTQCPDNRRKVALQLTDKGRAAFEASARETQAAMAQVLASLPEKDHHDIVRLMSQLKDLFDPHTCFAKADSHSKPKSKSTPKA